MGALRALFEAEIYPDLLVGTSIGAINAGFLAVKGLSLTSLQTLEDHWLDAEIPALFPSSSPGVLMKILLNRFGFPQGRRIREFFLEHEMTENLRFRDLSSVKLVLVASDLNHGSVVTFGKEDDLVLEGLIASSAIPPWVHPVESGGRFLVDGGALSNLAIEVAVDQGAEEIIAFDLSDSRDISPHSHGFGPFYSRLSVSTEKRIRILETRLARAQGVGVFTLNLHGSKPLSLLDFHDPRAAIDEGYQIARKALSEGMES